MGEIEKPYYISIKYYLQEKSLKVVFRMIFKVLRTLNMQQVPHVQHTCKTCALKNVYRYDFTNLKYQMSSDI